MSESQEFRKLLDQFVAFASEKIGLKSAPQIEIGQLQNTFGCFSPSENKITVATKHRHPMDIFRTVAHELIHHDQKLKGKLEDVDKAGETGSDVENEANAEAGKIMRHFARAHPELFKLEHVNESHFAVSTTHKRAVIVMGGPASGKDYVIKNVLHGYGLHELNPDQLHSSSAFKAGKGLILSVAGTSTAFNFGKLKDDLTEAGYQTILVFVHTTFDTARARTKNKSDNLYFKWDGAETMRPLLRLAFGNKYFEIDNSISDTAEGVKKFMSSLAALRKVITNFITDKVAINEEFQTYLNEGVYDPNIFKAVFIVGGPASGKDYVRNKILSGAGLREVNSDEALEHLMRKKGLSFLMPDSEAEERTQQYFRGKDIIKKKQNNFVDGRLGVIINGTGSDFDKMKKKKEMLEKLGYRTSLLFVDVNNETSRERNLGRGSRGGRSVPEQIRQDKWDDAQKLKSIYKEMFGDHYVEYENFTANSDEEKARQKVALAVAQKKINKFLAQPPTPEAQNWIDDQLAQKNRLNPAAGKTERYREPKGSSKTDSTGRKAGGEFRKKLSENTPSDREWGRPSLTKIYAGDTPGQTKKIVRKKLNEKKNDKLPVKTTAKKTGGVDTNQISINLGPSMGGGASVPMNMGVSESLQAWANNPATQERFRKKYGNLAEKKLIETVNNLSTIDFEKPKTKNLRELLDYGSQQVRMTGPKEDELGEDGVKKVKKLNITKKR